MNWNHPTADATSPITTSQGATVRQSGGFSTFRNFPCVWPESMSGQPDAPLRVLVVDSDEHARGVMTQELMSDSRTVVCGQTDSLRSGRRLVREVGFDVLLVNIKLDDGEGFDLITYARGLRPAAEIIAVTSASSDADAMRAFQLGAAGFVDRTSWFVTVVQAVLQVANGGATINPALSRRLLLRPTPTATDAPTAQVRDLVRVKLSAREQEVLKMIAGGLTSNDISARLTISCTTVNSHVKNIYQKLHVRSRAQAVSCANSWGLL